MKEEEKNKSRFSPDPETLHSTDPQKQMKGPFSSAVHKVSDKVRKDDEDEPVPDKVTAKDPDTSRF
ncbi:hypothetical protein [Flaviaesturariibacter terrae]